MITEAQSEAIYNLARDYRACYVVVDPLAGFSWQDCLGDLPEGAVETTRIDHEFFGQDSDAAPNLLHVPFAHFDTLEALASIAREEAVAPSRQTRSVCGFIVSQLNPAALAGRLAVNFTVRVNFGKRYFRCFDPRVMHHLPALLPAEAFYFHDIPAWGYFTWDGEWAVHRFAAPATRPALRNHLTMTDTQWRPFEAIEAFNATVAAFGKADFPCPVSETAQLREAVIGVIDSGITKPRDVAAYLLYQRRWRLSPAQHPRWSEARVLAAEGVPLQDALDAIVSPAATEAAPLAHRSK